MAQMPGEGLTWLTALATLPDAKGRERLYASYVKVAAPLKIQGHGLMVYQDDKERFEHAKELKLNEPLFPSGHTFRHMENGVDHVYFANPFPLTRVRATGEDFLKIEEHQAFTCLLEGSKLDEQKLDRTPDGKLRFSWRKNAPPLGPADEAKLIRKGLIKKEEACWQLQDHATGKSIQAHAGSVHWNTYRKRWVLITVQSGGTSFLGEVWYAEALSPVGPWNEAVKVVTHDRYSFYNPTQHPTFDQDGGRFIFFEGTYTHTFSGFKDATPRYDYNQIMYRLDLADPRLQGKMSEP